MQAVLERKSPYNFHDDATYVISGGLGGLGRNVARWMVSRGAKNLILLSRSGARNEAATVFLEELRAKGVCVEAPSCDIIDQDNLKAKIVQYAQTMPPIRGCVQGSMVLKARNFLANLDCLTPANSEFRTLYSRQCPWRTSKPP